VSINQTVPKTDRVGALFPLLTTVEYLRVYAPEIIGGLLSDDVGAALASDENWMAAREAEFAIPALFDLAGQRLHHVALLGWCFAPARD